MRSIPQALLWETLSRGRWSLPGCFLLGNFLPLLTYGALSGFPFNAQDREFVVLQFAFLPLVIFQFALGIVFALGPMSRLYTTPISAGSIVAWHTITGAAILALETMAAAWLYNSLFHVDWPYLGPGLFAVAAWSAVQVLLSAGTKISFRGFCFSFFVVMFLCVWINSRYGSWLSPPTHYWKAVTAIEFATLTIAFSLCYVLSCWAVARNRCGEQLRTSGLSTWLLDKWDQVGASRSQLRPFRSAAHGHFWYEWTTKGPALPLVTFFVIALASIGGLGSWWLKHSSLNNLFEGVLVLGGLLTLLAMGSGVLLGFQINSHAVGQRESKLGDAFNVIEFESLGSFLGSRPLACRDLAGAILKTAALSGLIAWGIWFVLYAACLLLLWMNQELPNSLFPPKIGVLYFPLTILGPWVAMTSVAAIGLTGRRASILMAVIGLSVSILVFVLCVAVYQFVPSSATVLVYQVCVWSLSVLVSLVALWAFVQARRKNHLNRTTMIASAIAFVCVIIVGIVFMPATISLAEIPLVFAFAVLVVLPFATFPLAIAWNRHR